MTVQVVVDTVEMGGEKVWCVRLICIRTGRMMLREYLQPNDGLGVVDYVVHAARVNGWEVRW